MARAVGSVWKSINDAKVRKRAIEELRSKIASQLHACDILVQEIEGSIGLHLVPGTSPVHRVYMQALELRRQSYETLNSSNGHDQILVASEKANRAIQGLTHVRTEIESGTALP